MDFFTSLAVSNGHTECVKLLLAAPGIDSRDFPPLCVAAITNDPAKINQLLADGANPNQQDNIKRCTPLHWAAINGHTECVRLLLSAPRIDINKASNNGVTPLYSAEIKGHTECANLIREAGGRR